MVKRIFGNGQQLLLKQQSSIVSAALVITVSSMLSAVLGLLRNRLLVSEFFATQAAELDAYWVAFRLPELAFQLLVIGSVSAAFIPVYTKYLQKDVAAANRVASTVMSLVILGFLGISVGLFIFAEPLLALITGEGFSAEQIRLAASLSRVMLAAQFFFAVSNFLTGVIQAHQRFLIPALSPIAYNLGIMLGIVGLSSTIGIYGPAVGVVLGAFLHLLIQVPVAYRLKFRYQFSLSLSFPGVKEMLSLIPPRVLAISVNQLELFATVFFTTALSAGSLTIMNLAQQLMTAPTRIFSVPLGQASLPFLANQVAKGSMGKFKQTLLSSLHHILFLAFPAGMLLLILRIPLVRLAYGSSSFPWVATLTTGKVVAVLSLSLFAQGAIHILTRAFYALHNTVVPFVVSLIAVVVHVGLSYLAIHVYEWGVVGLGVAISISTMTQFGLLMAILYRKVGGFLLSDLLTTPTKVIFASTIMGLSLWAPMRFLDLYVFDTTRTVYLLTLTIIVGVIGTVVYFGICRWLMVPEVKLYASLMKRLGNWRSVLSQGEEVLELPSQTQEIKPF